MGIYLSDLFCVTESDMISFDMRTRSLARSRATTVVEEEMDCNTRIVQEGEGMSSVYVCLCQHDVLCLQMDGMC